MADNPTKQGKVKSEVGYKKPPVERQFGQPNGNQRRHTKVQARTDDEDVRGGTYGNCNEQRASIF